MLTKWFLTKQFTGTDGVERPCCNAYGLRFMVAGHTRTEYVFCLMITSAHQIEAATADPRVEVYRTLWSKLGPKTIETFKEDGAVAGMKLGELLDILCVDNPIYMTTQLH